jgi:hypothetical protein
MKELLEYIVKALVDNPDSVEIKEVAGDRVTIYELRASKEDLGKIIGKRGRTASALRTLINSVASRDGKRCVLEILE